MKKVMIAVVIAAAGCAGVERERMAESASASGHWNGSIQLEGWQRPLALEVNAGAWRARWLSPRQAPDRLPTDIEVSGEQVAFTLDNLRFMGHIDGDRLYGRVVELDGGAPPGEFSLDRDEGQPLVNY